MSQSSVTTITSNLPVPKIQFTVSEDVQKLFTSDALEVERARHVLNRLSLDQHLALEKKLMTEYKRSQAYFEPEKYMQERLNRLKSIYDEYKKTLGEKFQELYFDKNSKERKMAMIDAGFLAQQLADNELAAKLAYLDFEYPEDFSQLSLEEGSKMKEAIHTIPALKRRVAFETDLSKMSLENLQKYQQSLSDELKKIQDEIAKKSS